ncbi:MAG TPA: SAM-dependent chlorinase/fluorinase [Pyrinomonadaceae bacterium]|nr:SAM-dependent chlorinase/fluorinase [Pyrinomonadaceae bacterium]
MKNRRGDNKTRRHGDERPFLRVAASARPDSALITLLTDFGTADYFVAAVKGVILGANPAARIVDITHEIPPQDIEAAAFTLLAAYSAFPPGTVHLAVVDPGVGSTRRPILMQMGGQFFVGPDNGVFSYLCEKHEKSGETAELFHLTSQKYFRQPVSATFHGRDVFAPVAAALSLGVQPAELGTETVDFVRLASLQPTATDDGRLTARIIHIDRFGNCVTNLTQDNLTADMIAAGVTLRLNGKSVKAFRNYFAEEAGSREKLFAIWGSAGFLEIAATNTSAAKLL